MNKYFPLFLNINCIIQTNTSNHRFTRSFQSNDKNDYMYLMYSSIKVIKTESLVNLRLHKLNYILI